MFKGMHSIFWVGLILLYGYNLGMMAVEMMGWLRYDGTGVAPQFFYVSLFSLILLNVFVAWLWVYVPEKVERRQSSQSVERHGHDR